MLFSKISSSEKTALHFLSRKISYAELLEEIKFRASYFELNPADYLLCHNSELENLLNFLSIIYTGQKAVFGGKKLNPVQKIELAHKHHLSVIDFSPEGTYKVESEKKVSKKTHFLGIISPKNTIIWKDYQSWFSAFSAQSEIFNIQKSDHIFVLDALAYSANLNTVLHGLWLGANLTISTLTESESWTKTIKENKISSLFLVPSHLNLLPNSEKFPEVKSVVTAGEKVYKQNAEKLFKNFPKAKITEYYGAAELGHISYLQNQEIIDKPTSVGKPFPGVKISIKNDKIWVDSPYVSPDFRDNPTVSDLGFIDANGYLTLLGRSGRIFQKRPFNVYSDEIPALSESFPKETEILLTKKEVVKKVLIIFLKSVIEKIPSYVSLNIDTKSLVLLFKILSKKPTEEDIVFSISA